MHFSSPNGGKVLPKRSDTEGVTPQYFDHIFSHFKTKNNGKYARILGAGSGDDAG